MFKKILLSSSATEGSDYAARVAFNMASNLSAHLVIFHVIGVPTRGFSQFVLDIKTNSQVQVDDDYIEWVKEEIKNYYSEQIKSIKSYEIKVAIGHPYREILRAERNEEPDLIVLGGSTNTGAMYKKNVVGSTVHLVTKSTTSPVLVVNRPAASFWGGISNIVFVADFSDKLDMTFKFSLDLVKYYDAEFHVFKVLDVRDGFLSQDEIDLKIREEIESMRHRYENNIKSVGCKKYLFNVWEGSLYLEIVKYAREQQADLIIIAQHHNKNSTEVVNINSNIEQIIARSGCPVLSISQKIHNKKR